MLGVAYLIGCISPPWTFLSSSPPAWEIHAGPGEQFRSPAFWLGGEADPAKED
jgi:hypothetical protein